MKLRLSALGLAASLVAASATSAAAADKDTRQMMADIRMLQEQEQQIQTALTALTEQIKSMDKSVSARIDEQTETTRKALADEKTVTTSMLTDLRSVREKLDDNTTRVGSLTVEVQALRQLITTRAPMGPSDAMPAGAPDSGASASAAGSAAAQGASPTALYDSAFGDYTAGQYDLAIDGFKALINSYPTAPQAADAQVNICNSYLNEQPPKYQEAADACDTAIRNYPKAPVVAMAYYRKGLALKKLNQPEQARAAFDYVIKTWPDSTERALAEQNLPDLKKP